MFVEVAHALHGEDTNAVVLVFKEGRMQLLAFPAQLLPELV